MRIKPTLELNYEDLNILQDMYLKAYLSHEIAQKGRTRGDNKDHITLVWYEAVTRYIAHLQLKADDAEEKRIKGI